MAIDAVLYDEEAAGRYIGGAKSPVSPRTLQRWRLEGIGPIYVKLGRLVRYRQTDLDRFLDESTRTSTSMISKVQLGRNGNDKEAGNA